MGIYLTSKGHEILVDDADMELINQYTWYVNSLGYAQAYIKGTGRKSKKYILMHRLLLDFPKGKMIDHKNLNRSDNRRTNLRLCTSQQNTANIRAYNKNSKYKGIYPTYGGRWRAMIQYDGKKDCLGTYDTEQEAASAYDTAARKYFGNFALLNIPTT